MISKDKLEEYKGTIQAIIDKYLPEDKRFSVKNFNQEGLYYLASLFLEKNPKKRKEIYKEIEEKKKEAEKKFQTAEKNFLELNNEIIEKKEEYDKIINTIDELNTLSNNINDDQNFDTIISQF